VNGGSIRAAGGVLWRARDPWDASRGVEVAVIHRPRYDDWSLPKGKLAPGESDIDGAIREVLEETGFHVRLGRSLGDTRYVKEMDGVSRPKVVRWWAMEATAGTFVPTREVDELRWVTLGEAHEMLTRETDRDLLERFVRGPAPTRVVLLVRHASAGSRSAWTGEDRTRPLDTCGWAQADELVRLLAHFDPTEIVSADYRRCTQTVEPLSGAITVPVRPDPVFSEAGYPGCEADAVARLREIGGPHGTAVVCSQGDVIPDLLQRISDADELAIGAVEARKGSTWVLTFLDDRLLGADYIPPPRVPECES
jgi:8-oxo-dGTP diphosphatase